ncbi:Uu.00g068100.m01.CDS01 [Anthostomella pinea]|uniref:Uu.00g068100.m01.CDS01 n=1 Tax=Anthostomella pinea TaxID=933095 RepID=A0AAI8VUW5_9PEZI|nr:Uu.00g068100.m01.CDS01 [Anthostomella pinea]
MVKTLNFALLGACILATGWCAPAGVGPDALGPNGGITGTKGLSDTANITYCGDAGAATILTGGDPEEGPGFWITNNDDDPKVRYFLYENSRDDHAWKYLMIPQGGRAFVKVCDTWQGHVVRGTEAVNFKREVHNLGTWFVSNVDENGIMWGDVSFLQGCDGGGSVKATDGSGVSRVCLQDMLAGAPAEALATKATGTQALARIVGDGANQAARAWGMSKCSPNEVWLDNLNSNSVISSANGRLEWVAYKGRA